jgi:hypothetical protein
METNTTYTYQGMINAGYKMTADGFWYKPSSDEINSDKEKIFMGKCPDDITDINGNQYTLSLVDPKLGTFKVNKKEIMETSTNHLWKYNEDKTIKALEEYMSSTYHSHYASEDSKVQVLDIIESIGDGIPFCRDNLIKYSCRFGKKSGMSKLDALKIMHYGALLYNFAGFNNETKDSYETF